MRKRVHSEMRDGQTWDLGIPRDCCKVQFAGHSFFERILPTREYATHYIVTVSVNDRKVAYRRPYDLMVSSCGKVMEVL